MKYKKIINFFGSEKIIRLTSLQKDTVEVANEILVGNIRVFTKLPNVKVKAIEELWEMQFDSAPSTYALYTYALYPVSYLLNAYEESGCVNYLNKALALTLDFVGWELKISKNINEKRSKLLFGDHAVSNRTQVLCYLSCCLKKEGLIINEKIKDAIIRNGKYLADTNNYSHYNHGLMMDLALLGMITTLKGLDIEYPEYFKEALIERLNYSIARDITEDGVHIENSPGYHFWILGFIRKITPVLKNFDKLLHDNAQMVLKKAEVYASYITRSNGTVPALGDTHAGVSYKPQKGLESKFFQHANQLIFRSDKDDVWAHIVCGYKTHIHKHCDNGSFILYYKGIDLLIDPGFLNYENSVEAMKMKSASFHNVARPINHDQDIKKVEILGKEKNYAENISGSKIENFINNVDIEVAFALIADYSDFLMKRIVIWLKPNSFIILDVINDANAGVEQFFHIAPDLKVELNESKKINIFSSNNLQCSISAVDLDGLQPDPCIVELLPGYIASNFNEKKYSTLVKFTSSGRYACVLIKLGNDAVDSKVLNFFEKDLLKELILNINFSK